MQIFYKELTLEAGFALSDLPKHSRIVMGREVSMASGIALFRSLRGEPIKCWQCGCVADRWISGKGASDKVSKPVLNLFATKHFPATKKHDAHFRIVMMTQDHIIPRAYGGRDTLENLRPGCEICNVKRGSKLTKQDRVFMAEHPELIDPIRAAKGAETRARMAAEEEKRRRHKEHMAAMKELQRD